MNEAEFWKCIAPLQDDIFRFSLSILKNEADASDAVQEVMLKLWQKRDQLVGTERLKPLVMKTTKNHCIDLLRKQKRRTGTGISDGQMAIEPNYEHTDLLDFIKQQCSQLPEAQRMVLELKDFQGYDYSDISEIMDVPIPSLRVLLSRARKAVLAKIHHGERSI